MIPFFEREISRRELGGYTAALTLTLAGCNTGKQKPEVASQKESEPAIVVPQQTVFEVGKELFQIRNQSAFPIQREDFEEFKDKSGFNRKGGVLIQKPSLDGYQRKEPPKEKMVTDYFTGYEKRNNTKGGIKLVHFSGFLDGRSGSYDPTGKQIIGFVEQINLSETFGALDQSLVPSGYFDIDGFHFTFGRNAISQNGRVDTHSVLDTIADPKVNLQYARDFFRKLKEQNPFDQFIPVIYSLGGIIAIPAIMEHADAINDIFFVDATINGLNPTAERLIEYQAIQNYLKTMPEGKEKDFISQAIYVVKFLFDYWNNQQERLRFSRFIQEFAKIGKTATSVQYDGDSIVPNDSSYIPEAQNIHNVHIPGAKHAGFDVRRVADHGAPLQHQIAKNELIRVTGKNPNISGLPSRGDIVSTPFPSLAGGLNPPTPNPNELKIR